MKILIVFYSRTGITKKIAEVLSVKFGAEIEEITDTIDRSGMKGYLISGRDAMKKRLTRLEPIKSNLGEYDMIIIGTPIWGWNMSVPIRTFINEQKNNFKQVAFFCTMGGSGNEKAFSEMSEILGKNPKATLALKTVEVVKNNFAEKIDKFIAEIKN